MRIRIEGRQLPGHNRPGADNVAVGVQRGSEVVETVTATSSGAAWFFECTAKDTGSGVDVTGPHIHGRRGDRFIYLSWGTVDGAGTFTMFRRAKLMLGEVDPKTWSEAAAGIGTLTGRLSLTDAKGEPVCAAVRPPAIEWSLDGMD